MTEGRDKNRAICLHSRARNPAAWCTGQYGHLFSSDTATATYEHRISVELNYQMDPIQLEPRGLCQGQCTKFLDYIGYSFWETFSCTPLS